MAVPPWQLGTGKRPEGKSVMNKQTVAMVYEGNQRRPDLPEHVGFRLLEDHGDTATVEVLGDWPPVTLKADVWRRATDDEIDQIDAVLADPPDVEGMTPKQIIRVWRDTREIEHTDRLYSVVWTIAVDLFGEDRAAEILAESK